MTDARAWSPSPRPNGEKAGDEGFRLTFNGVISNLHRREIFRLPITLNRTRFMKVPNLYSRSPRATITFGSRRNSKFPETPSQPNYNPERIESLSPCGCRACAAATGNTHQKTFPILKGLNHSAHGCRVCEATMGNAHQKTFPTLKGLNHSAQRCEERATLGVPPNNFATLKGLHPIQKNRATSVPHTHFTKESLTPPLPSQYPHSTCSPPADPAISPAPRNLPASGCSADA